jgi:hypothetical protein
LVGFHHRLQAVLEDANIKLASVVSDIRGLSAREILQRSEVGAGLMQRPQATDEFQAGVAANLFELAD